MMPQGRNGPGFSSRDEAIMAHMDRMRPKATNLDYQFAARQPAEMVREPLPPSPLDGPQYHQTAYVERPAPPQEAPPPPPKPKKSLKEIAMELGQIPLKED